MRTNPFYGSPDDNSDVGEIIKFIDRQWHLSATYKDLFANRLTVKPSDDELKFASRTVEDQTKEDLRKAGFGCCPAGHEHAEGCPNRPPLPAPFARKPSLAHIATDPKPDVTVGGGSQNKGRDPLVILAELRSRIGEYPAQVEREYIALIDELRASLDREAVMTEWQKLKDASVQEAVKIAATTSGVAFGPQPHEPSADQDECIGLVNFTEGAMQLEPQDIESLKSGLGKIEAMATDDLMLSRAATNRPPFDSQPKNHSWIGLGGGVLWPPHWTLLDYCREFDAIDLSECNRRLEAGEPFDAACNEAMEKRQALGEQIKERLGSVWPEFEKSHEELTASFPTSSKLAEHALADVTAEAMKDVRSFFMFGALASRVSCNVPIDDCQTDFFGTAIRAMQRLMVLAKAFGIEARP